MAKPDNSALVAAFLARGGTVTRVPESTRVTNEKLARTRAEQFFRTINVRTRRPRSGETYVGR